MKKTYEARLLDDGHLSLPEEVRLQLALRSGDKLEVTIERLQVPAALNPDNPLVKMIGLCKAPARTDLSLKHDHYVSDDEDHP